MARLNVQVQLSVAACQLTSAAAAVLLRFEQSNRSVQPMYSGSKNR
jgi:hypothetical protein